jgi:Fe-S cluster assembly protein SufD
MSLAQHIIEDFASIKVSGLDTQRQSAFEAFELVGIPAPRSEAWKYTPIRNRLPEFLRMLGSMTTTSATYQPDLAQVIAGIRLVFVNGQYQSTLSDVPVHTGVTICNIAALSPADRATFDAHYHSVIKRSGEHFGLLNTAFALDGTYIHVSSQAYIETPIHIIHRIDAGAADTFVQSRTLIVAEAHSQVTVIEEFQNQSGAKWYNHATESICAAHAQVTHYTIQATNADTTSINFIGALQSEHSVFSSYSFSLAGQLVRNNIQTFLNGQYAAAHIFALYVGRGDMHQDYNLLAHHEAPNCPSNQIIKGILMDQATGVFNGKIYVQRDAQKTNSFQSSKAVLLSDEAAVYSKPQLEIYADDVKCSHGAAIGQVNHQQVFYLMARGIDERTARGILTFAFANEVIQTIPLEPLRSYMEQRLGDILGITV